ncbi:unnamed protein product [Rotaria sp. Silwood1]|nr:unnamed protein product [Rotaria sp. Silwood1]CAF1595230.1 unnamed protein product [Rotaria sp. Silwood1]
MNQVLLFNNCGRGEVPRLIFAAAGQKYEDIHYEDDEWLLHKSEMPMLEVDSTKLPQSKVIARFLANSMNKMMLKEKNFLNSYPLLKQNRAEVEKQPKIADYLKNRSKTSI